VDDGGYWQSNHQFGELCARDLMSRDVATVYPRDSIERAARLMAECDCGALPVTDTEGRLLGMVTDRDIAVRLVARGADTRRAAVHHCMTDEAFACDANAPIEECLRTISRHQVRRVPVVDERNRVVGIISQSDLVRQAGANPGRGERRTIANALRDVSEPIRASFRRD
jgi:CBS domain-containing protein